MCSEILPETAAQDLLRCTAALRISPSWPYSFMHDCARRTRIPFAHRLGCCGCGCRSTRQSLRCLLRRRIELTTTRTILFPASSITKPRNCPRLKPPNLVRSRRNRLLTRLPASPSRTILDHLLILRSVVIKTAGLTFVARNQSPRTYAAVLRSHPLIHTAEAALFRQAFDLRLSRDRGLTVISARERELWLNAAEALGIERSATA